MTVGPVGQRSKHVLEYEATDSAAELIAGRNGRTEMDTGIHARIAVPSCACDNVSKHRVDPAGTAVSVVMQNR